MSNTYTATDILLENLIRNINRMHYAGGIRTRKRLGDANRYPCPKLSDWMEKAKGELVLAGPKGRLP